MISCSFSNHLTIWSHTVEILQDIFVIQLFGDGCKYQERDSLLVVSISNCAGDSIIIDCTSIS